PSASTLQNGLRVRVASEAPARSWASCSATDRSAITLSPEPRALGPSLSSSFTEFTLTVGGRIPWHPLGVEVMHRTFAYSLVISPPDSGLDDVDTVTTSPAWTVPIAAPAIVEVTATILSSGKVTANEAFFSFGMYRLSIV